MGNSRGVIYSSFLVVTCIFIAFLFVLISSVSGAPDLPPIIKFGELKSYIEPNLAVVESFYESEANSPQMKSKHKKKKPVSRIIIVGDIHGCYDALKSLLKKANYDRKYDQLVSLGDFISKGKQNFEVLDFLIENDAACVLGNHEVNILEKYASYYSYSSPKYCNSLENDTCVSEENLKMVTTEKPKFDLELSIAKRLKPNHIDYLTNCSILLDLGPIAHGFQKTHADVSQPLFDSNGDTQVSMKASDGSASINYSKTIEGLAVHAGLQWHLDYIDQSVNTMVNLRALFKPNYTEPCFDSIRNIDETITKPWSEIWNIKQQEKLNWSEGRMVFYGHEASRGLVEREYSTGLDTGCVAGKKLTAAVVTGKFSKKHKKTIYNSKIVQVSC